MFQFSASAQHTSLHSITVQPDSVLGFSTIRSKSRLSTPRLHHTTSARQNTSRLRINPLHVKAIHTSASPQATSLHPNQTQRSASGHTKAYLGFNPPSVLSKSPPSSPSVQPYPEQTISRLRSNAVPTGHATLTHSSASPLHTTLLNEPRHCTPRLQINTPYTEPLHVNSCHVSPQQARSRLQSSLRMVKV